MAEVSHSLPVGLPDAGQLGTTTQQLVLIPDLEARAEAVQTLFKLIDGVLASPLDEKKRRVKKANDVFHRKVGRHAAAVDFLRVCGFKDADDMDNMDDEAGRNALLSLPIAYMTRLIDAHHSLAMISADAGVSAPTLPVSTEVFNPYGQSIQATESTSTLKVPANRLTEAERVRNQVKKRQQDLQDRVESAPTVPLRPSVFWLSSGRRLEEVIQETCDDGLADVTPLPDVKAADAELIRGMMAGAKGAMAGPANFESADKRRLVELSRTKAHEICVLRVVCPDKSVLQVTFRAADKGEVALAQIGPLLAPHIRAAKWYLYQSPPMRRLDPKESFVKAGLAPGASMYLGFEGDKPAAPYFEATLTQQLGPAPVPQGGVESVTSFSGEAMGWGSGKKLGAEGGPPPSLPAVQATPASST